MTRCPWLATCSSSSFAALSHPSWRHRSLRCFGGELAELSLDHDWRQLYLRLSRTCHWMAAMKQDGKLEEAVMTRRKFQLGHVCERDMELWPAMKKQRVENWSCHWIWNKILLLVLFYICKSCWLSYHLSGVVKCLCQCFCFTSNFLGSLAITSAVGQHKHSRQWSLAVPTPGLEAASLLCYDGVSCELCVVWRDKFDFSCRC